MEPPPPRAAPQQSNAAGRGEEDWTLIDEDNLGDLEPFITKSMVGSLEASGHVSCSSTVSSARSTSPSTLVDEAAASGSEGGGSSAGQEQQVIPLGNSDSYDQCKEDALVRIEAELKASNERREEETAELRRQVDVARTAVAAARAQAKAAIDELSGLRAEHTSLKAEHTSLKTEHTSLKTEHTSLKTEHTSLEAQRQALQAQVVTLEASNQGLRDRCDVMELERRDQLERQHRLELERMETGKDQKTDTNTDNAVPVDDDDDDDAGLGAGLGGGEEEKESSGQVAEHVRGEGGLWDGSAFEDACNEAEEVLQQYKDHPVFKRTLASTSISIGSSASSPASSSSGLPPRISPPPPPPPSPPGSVGDGRRGHYYPSEDLLLDCGGGGCGASLGGAAGTPVGCGGSLLARTAGVSLMRQLSTLVIMLEERSRRKIALDHFEVGDLALFFPVPKPHQQMLAFNVGCPHHYLAPESRAVIGQAKHFNSSYVLGQIVQKEQHRADASVKHISTGTTYYTLSVTAVAPLFDYNTHVPREKKTN